MSDEERRDHEL
jgi:hypothetical protein